MNSRETTTDLSVSQNEADYEAARDLFKEYVAWLGIDLSFQRLDHELDHLSTMYGPPGGCLIIGRDAGAPVACVGLRRRSDHTAEMKRLFVREAARGRGLGRTLALEAIEHARRLGYHRVVLDTLDQMSAAHGLYAALGFEVIEPYYENPIPGARFMALDIRPGK